MKRSRDPLVLPPHWHIDCRIPAELPEDTIVGPRFLAHVLAGALALGALLFTGWLGYLSLSLRYQIHDWEQRIKENRAEVADIQRMQREFAVESAKIDQAYALVKPQFYVSAFLANIGRTRPEQMIIDVIEWNEAGVVLRGSMQEKSQRASQLLGDYVKQLKRDEKISPLFGDIHLTDIDRGATGDTLRFEIKFTLKGGRA